MRARLLLAAAAVLLGLTACTADVHAPGADATAAPGPRCVERPSAAAAPGGTESGPALPAMALPCFSGGRYTDIADLGGMPTVVNLWASWCEPCRKELPELQRFSVAGQGRVRVVGIATKDRHDQAQSVIEDDKLTFTILEDQGQQFATAVSPVVSKALFNLPATLFITPQGRIAYVYQGEALTEARLRELTNQHLGVSV
ncbi:TlpA family protein disulfide reductase [Dactylosporangium sp. CA-233914]|uniref:TlpA family protein disulfide reductase n=1 Tax=Dactylosporangium sp. CA-233914 TaxID=3239934 RepID=UPI003D921FA2